jgi:S-disulfanyl-L-cysteine oxidoreductase SoxD
MCNSVKLFRTLLLLISCSWSAGGFAANAPGYYTYGKAASAAEIAGWDIDIRPDGQGLPEGSGSVEDGEGIYERKCAECHGSFGEGVGQFPILAGGNDTLTHQRPVKTVGSYWGHTSTLFDYIRRTMPFSQPASLEDNEVYALTAYVLYLNDIVADDFVLDRENFATVQLPNRNNFVPDPRPDVDNKRCMKNCRNPAEITISSSVSAPPPAALSLPTAEAALPADHPGAQIYEQYCMLCHKTGVAGAPMLGDKKQWDERLAQGLAVVQKHAIEGYTGKRGVMPAKGGFADLADDAVRQAVQYMSGTEQ